MEVDEEAEMMRRMEIEKTSPLFIALTEDYHSISDVASRGNRKSSVGSRLVVVADALYVQLQRPCCSMRQRAMRA